MRYMHNSHYYDTDPFHLRLHSTTCAFVHFERIPLYRQGTGYQIGTRLLRGKVLWLEYGPLDEPGLH
jgi:hypothetical protein